MKVSIDGNRVQYYRASDEILLKSNVELFDTCPQITSSFKKARKEI